MKCKNCGHGIWDLKEVGSTGLAHTTDPNDPTCTCGCLRPEQKQDNTKAIK